MTDDTTRNELRKHEDDCSKRYNKLWDAVETIKKEGHDFQVSMVKKVAELSGQVKLNSQVTWLILAILVASLVKDFMV